MKTALRPMLFVHALTLTLLLVASTSAQAGLVYSAALGTDPTAQGWTKSGTNQTETVSGGTFTFGNAYNPVGITYQYEHASDDFRDGFSMTINDFRMVSETTTSFPNNGNFMFGANRGSFAGANAYVPHFWINSDRIWSGLNQSYNTAYLFDTTSAAHDYTVNYASDGSYDFLIDGVVIAALSGSATLAPQSFNKILIGDDTHAVSGVYEFSSIELSSSSDAAVPTPAPLGLLALGLAGLGLHKRIQ